MFVYRVEDSEGRGPYFHFTGPHVIEFDRLVGGPHIDETHPCPESDDMDPSSIFEWHLFGFKDMQQLYAWFPGLKRLDSPLFEVVCYSVAIEHVLFGGRQLVFDSREAVRIE